MASRRKEPRKSRPLIEWIFGAASALAVACIIAFLGFEALFGDASPPDLRVAIDRLERVSSGTLVMVALTNGGDRAAAEVGVRAVVTAQDGATEKEILFDYIAAHAVRHGAFMIEDPNVTATDLALTIDGFVEP